ncbi:MAG: hypothetical protein ACRCX3_09700, partial [Cetobacterium sp.]
MKKYLILIILLFVSACDKNEVTKIYYKNGQLKTELIYEKGKDNGIVKDYFESGELQSERVYKSGELNGVTKIYY